MLLLRLLLGCAVLLLLILTKPESYGDTSLYVHSTILASKREFASRQNPLWDFGHLLWRPIGSWCWQAIDAMPYLREQFNETQRAYLPFIAISTISGILGVGLMYAIARQFVGDTWVAVVAAGGLLTSHAYLNYWQSGHSYNPGLTCVLASIYFADRARRSNDWLRPTVAAGFFLAVAILFWISYVLVAPVIAIFLMVPFPKANEPRPFWRQRLKPVAVLTLVTVLIGAAAYGWVAKENGITTAKEFVDWAEQASHGMAQTKRLLRLPTALPRTLVHVGEDGMMLKRFVLKDPYASVSLLDLLRMSVVKMVAFYGCMALLLYALSRTARGRWALLFLGLIVGINVVFAVTVFEPSQIDRYLPSYPFFWLAMAIALKTAQPRTQLVLCGAVAFMAVNNAVALSPRVHGSRDDETFARRALLREIPSGSKIVLLNFKDELWRQQDRLPFHPEMRVSLPVYDLLATGVAGAAETWRAKFANECLRAFQSGGQVWVSERVLRDRPLPDWKWVEGDQQGVTWTDFPQLFRSLAYSEKRGSGDGFRRLVPSPANLEKLHSLAAGAPKEQ